MSLWPIKTVTNIFPYTEYVPGLGFIYAGYLIVPPRKYLETVKSITHFFYEPGNDQLVAYVWEDYVWWPGWKVYRYTWDADGNFTSKTQTQFWVVVYATNAGTGSFGRVFTTYNSSYLINEVSWDNFIHDPAMYSVNPNSWTPGRIFGHARVNLQDKLIVGVSNWWVDIWDISGTPTLRSSLRLPNTLGYLAYESRDICWVVTRDGWILKLNYKINPARWEMMSQVQNPSIDALNYFITWDTKRGRLVVLRQRPDAADGSSQSQFEFYQPFIKLAGITDPVPVSRHRVGDKTELVAHLYGNVGEGLTSYLVNGSLQLPAVGRMLRGEGTATGNGAVSFLYESDQIGEDTLVLTTSIEDGAV